MSERQNKPQTPLWWVYPVDGSKAPELFTGGLAEVVAEINARHVATGIQHASREVRDE